MCIRSGSFAKLLRRRPCHDFLPCALRVTQSHQIGGMSHRAACGWRHLHVNSGPVRSSGPVPFAVTARALLMVRRKQAMAHNSTLAGSP